MNISSVGRGLLVLLFAASSPAFAQTVTFATETSIGVGDTNYDGAAITITNCTVTIDGPHSFAGLLVQEGGKLTHSVSSSGVLDYLLVWATDQLALAGTNTPFLSHSNVVLSNLLVTDLVGAVVYTNDVDYTLIVNPDGSVMLGRTATSSISDGATVSVDYSYLNPVLVGLDLAVSGDVVVELGGAIDVSAKGYPAGTGPGAGRTSGSPASGGGGGHGGSGGLSLSNALGGFAYGQISEPFEPGSGGGNGYAGPGGCGGGVVRISATGSFRIDGAVLAGGVLATNERAGGGAGGSIW
ncbi:MAG TPA: hypothetical protein VJA21_15385, partial [Verrucomicrobiae bacterium]